MDIEEGIIVMEEGDGAAVCGARFWNEGSAAVFCSGGHDACGEDDISEFLEVCAPPLVKAGKDVEGVVLVADFVWDWTNDWFELWCWNVRRKSVGGRWSVLWMVLDFVVVGPGKLCISVFALGGVEGFEFAVCCDNSLLGGGREVSIVRMVVVEVSRSESAVKM